MTKLHALKTFLVLLSWPVLLSCQANETTSRPHIEHMSLHDGVKTNAVIARVRITGRKPMTFEFLGESFICGYRYQAKVLESLKGNEKEFEFVGGDESFKGFEFEYFIMAALGEAGYINNMLLEMKPDYRDQPYKWEELKCGMGVSAFASDADTAYFTSTERLSLFDPFAEKDIGGKWIYISDMINSIVTYSNVELKRLKSKYGEPYALADWNEVKAKIEKNLAQNE